MTPAALQFAVKYAERRPIQQILLAGGGSIGANQIELFLVFSKWPGGKLLFVRALMSAPGMTVQEAILDPEAIQALVFERIQPPPGDTNGPAF